MSRAPTQSDVAGRAYLALQKKARAEGRARMSYCSSMRWNRFSIACPRVHQHATSF